AYLAVRLLRNGLLIVAVCDIEPASTDLYTLSLHDALPIFTRCPSAPRAPCTAGTARRILLRGSAPRGQRRHSAGQARPALWRRRSEEHTSELQSRSDLVCRLLLEKKQAALPLVLLLPHPYI